MSGKFTIKPPNWPRELTFVEFSRLNPHIKNENQLIQLYNQYLNKYLEELRQKKVHFKQSLNNHLLNELRNNNLNNTLDDFQDSHDGDSSINIVSSLGVVGDGGPPLNVNTFIKFEGNTGRTFNKEVAADYVKLFDPEEDSNMGHFGPERGFTISLLVKFRELGSIQTTIDQKFVFGRGASDKSQIRFGIEGNPILGNHFNIGVGDTTISSKIYSKPQGNTAGSGSGISLGNVDTTKFNHYALVYAPDNGLDTITSGSVKLYINGELTGSTDGHLVRFTPKKYDVNASNYEGGGEFFLGAHNQFRVVDGNVNNYTSVQPPNTSLSFRRYNNDISGYYDGLACEVDQLFISNEPIPADTIKKLYENSIDSADLEKDEELISYANAYYKFNNNILDYSQTKKLDGTFKENTTNVGIDNYRSDQTIEYSSDNEDTQTTTKGYLVIGDKFEVRNDQTFQVG